MAGLPSLPSLDGATASPTHTVSVTVKMDGKDVTQNPGGLVSLSIYREVNKVPSARLVITDGKVEKGTFAKSGSANFVPGKTTEILLGYQNKTESIFKGIVVKHSISILHGRGSALELTCHDPAVRMTLVRKSHYFIQQKDKDIFSEILQKYSSQGITAGDLADTTYTHPEMVQYHCTDWDFLVMRAEANGLVVLCQDGKVSIVKPETASSADFSVSWGKELIDFEAEMDTRTHFADVETTSWDSTEQKLLAEKGSGNSGTGASAGGLAGAAGGLASAVSSVASAAGIDLGTEDDKHHFPDVLYKSQSPGYFHGGDMATEELSAWAKGAKKRGELSQVRGRVKVRGRNFKVLGTIDLKKVAARFNGKHLVTGVMHQVYEGTWQTDIQFGLSTKTLAQTAPEIAVPDAAGLLPSIQGLHIGVVTKLEGDTQERVKVKIPMIASQGGSNEGVWARLATLTAGDKRGFVFRPEKGDEVILGFINNDPNDAIVLGSLHSKKFAAPVKPEDKNDQKGIYTRGGMHLAFDDQKKSIELKTKEGYTVVMSETDKKIEIRDKNENSIKLSESGIDMVSKTNISIKAEGNVSIKGKQVRINDP